MRPVDIKGPTMKRMYNKHVARLLKKKEDSARVHSIEMQYLYKQARCVALSSFSLGTNLSCSAWKPIETVPDSEEESEEEEEGFKTDDAMDAYA